LGLSLLELHAAALPTAPAELEGLVRLLGREAALSRAALLVDAQELDASDAPREAALARCIDAFRGLLVVAVRERRRLGRRTLLPLDVERPTAEEQGALWRAALGSVAPSLNGHIETLTAQFDLSAAGIRSAAAEILAESMKEQSGTPASVTPGRVSKPSPNAFAPPPPGTTWCSPSRSARSSLRSRSTSAGAPGSTTIGASPPAHPAAWA
jgi:hypothetical protein